MWKTGCGACPELVHPMRFQLMDVGAGFRIDIAANDDDSIHASRHDDCANDFWSWVSVVRDTFVQDEHWHAD
jgi:hypothetical protein